VFLQGAEDAQGCSIRLASVLPAQLDLSGGSSNPEGLCSVPGPLQQQLEEVQVLWQQLQGYLHGFEGLRGMVQHLVGTAAHPYAIDAVQLRAYGQAGGIQCTTTAPGAGKWHVTQHWPGQRMTEQGDAQFACSRACC
jgi:hypothetical protein